MSFGLDHLMWWQEAHHKDDNLESDDSLVSSMQYMVLNERSKP